MSDRSIALLGGGGVFGVAVVSTVAPNSGLAVVAGMALGMAIGLTLARRSK